MSAVSKSIFVWSASPILISVAKSDVIPVCAASTLKTELDADNPVPANKEAISSNPSFLVSEEADASKKSK